MNLEWLKSFVLASREKSLLQASEKLHISQPALTKQMRKLEEYYGIEFFRRTSVGIELTQEGRILRDRIEPILQDFDTIRDELTSPKSRSIRFGAPPSTVSYILPKLIMEWTNQGWEVSLTMSGDSNALTAAIHDGMIDVAILDESVVNNAKSLHLIKWLTEPFYCICLRDHPLAHKGTLSVDDVMTQALVMHPQGCEIRQVIESVFHQRGIEPVLSKEAPFGESIIAFVSAGAGIGIVPQGLAAHIVSGQIASRPIHDFPPRQLAFAVRTLPLRRILETLIQEPFT